MDIGGNEHILVGRSGTRRLCRNASGGCDDYVLMMHSSGSTFIASASNAVSPQWAGELLKPDLQLRFEEEESQEDGEEDGEKTEAGEPECEDVVQTLVALDLGEKAKEADALATAGASLTPQDEPASAAGATEPAEGTTEVAKEDTKEDTKDDTKVTFEETAAATDPGLQETGDTKTATATKTIAKATATGATEPTAPQETGAAHAAKANDAKDVKTAATDAKCTKDATSTVKESKAVAKVKAAAKETPKSKGKAKETEAAGGDSGGGSSSSSSGTKRPPQTPKAGAALKKMFTTEQKID